MEFVVILANTSAGNLSLYYTTSIPLSGLGFKTQLIDVFYNTAAEQKFFLEVPSSLLMQ
jgi:hypothetical protein